MSGATPFPFPLVDVEGGARERGRQYGRLAAERIATSLRVYMAAWTAGDSGVAVRTALLGRARAFEPVIGDRYPELLEEMRGIAEGAERALEEIVALNARTELLYGGAPDGCTGAVLLPERTGGRVIIGQNWDWRPACREAAIVLRVTPDRGPSFLTFVEAGMLARSGMNSAGMVSGGYRTPRRGRVRRPRIMRGLESRRCGLPDWQTQPAFQYDCYSS